MSRLRGLNLVEAEPKLHIRSQQSLLDTRLRLSSDSEKGDRLVLVAPNSIVLCSCRAASCDAIYGGTLAKTGLTPTIKNSIY